MTVINDSTLFSPQARSRRLVVQELEAEVLVYDLENNRAYCLNRTAAFVWKHADGKTPVVQIAFLLQKELRTAIDEAIVWFALENLKRNGLLETSAAAPKVFSLMNRRQLIGAAGKSAAVALPLVFSITAPRPAQAASGAAPLGNGNVCTSNAACTSNNCSLQTGRCCSAASGQACGITADCCQSGQSCSNGVCTTPTGGGGCVLYDTLITNADGSKTKAKNVLVGQMLLGVNCLNGETIEGRVKHVMKKSATRIYSIVAENGAVINCSPSHDLIEGFGDTDGKRAERFQVGDALLIHDQESGRIVETKTAAISYAEFFQPVIMFEMDTKEHTFVSGGIISHNVLKF
jgi:hypothetical protein